MGTGLRAEVLAERDPRMRCGVAAFINEKFDTEDRAELDEMLADKAVKTAVLARVLIRRGLPHRPDSVRKHRVGECSCGRQS